MTTPQDPYADDPRPSYDPPEPTTQNPFAAAADRPNQSAARPNASADRQNPFAAATAPPANGGTPRTATTPPAATVPPVTSAPPASSVPPSYTPPPATSVPRQSPPNDGLRISLPNLQSDSPAPIPSRSMADPMPLPIPGQGGARGDSLVRIGLWGSGRSGKSTYLAALPLAAMQGRHGTWVVAGTNEVAAQFLNASVSQLAGDRHFPASTTSMDGISWTFHGTPPPGGFNSILRSIGVRRQTDVSFTLDLYDPPGQYYRSNNVDPEALDHLANSNGLIYLVDPVMEGKRDGDDSFQYFYGALQLLTARMAAEGRLVKGRLPHAIAVCVTKFDDENFFRRLVTQTDLVTQDSDGHRLPRVPQERSQEFFDWVCARVLGGSAGMVQEGLRAHFLPDRIQYFATSSVGFRLNHNQIFDFRDFSNVVQRAGQRDEVRDRPRPINVLEPLIFLEQRIRAGRR
ncbi:hypothetical protein AB0M46_16765 [Dactylosporangium sp. NPDC051485]|uniref:hypothetical protein n=1 Tax=Dactylosporangium sp. NPDC051485 TaxID=3154846 RepID=UPI003446DA2C